MWDEQQIDVVEDEEPVASRRSNSSATVSDLDALYEDLRASNGEQSDNLLTEIDKSLAATSDKMQQDITEVITSESAALPVDVADELEKRGVVAAKSAGDSDYTVIMVNAEQAEMAHQFTQIHLSGMVFLCICSAAILGLLLWMNLSRGWRSSAIRV